MLYVSKQLENVKINHMISLVEQIQKMNPSYMHYTAENDKS